MTTAGSSWAGKGRSVKGEVHARPPTAAHCQDGRSEDCVRTGKHFIRDRPRTGVRITIPFLRARSPVSQIRDFLPSSLLPGS